MAAPSARADALLASLGRRFRGPALRVGFELHGAAVRQVFQRDFLYVSQQLFALESSRRVQGIDRGLLRAAQLAVARQADTLRTRFVREAAGWHALLEAQAQAHAPTVPAAAPRRLEATIVSPHARAFVDVLVEADRALHLLERAWLLGRVTPEERRRAVLATRLALRGFKEVVRAQRHEVGLHVRAVNAARHPAAPASDMAMAAPTSRVG